MTMTGPWGAKQYINDYLKEDLPARILKYRNAWNLDDKRLPTPEPDAFTTFELDALDTWPCISTVQIGSTMNRFDYGENADPIYVVTYQMRTYVWTRYERPDLTTESRDNLTTVVRASLLDRSCLRSGLHAASAVAHEVSLDEGSLREEYSELTSVKGDRYVAGAYLAYNFTLHEPVVRLPLGTMSAASVSISGVGPTIEDLT